MDRRAETESRGRVHVRLFTPLVVVAWTLIGAIGAWLAAIIGAIGLYLRYRHRRQDLPDLEIVENSPDTASPPNDYHIFDLTVKNTGGRRTTLESVLVEFPSLDRQLEGTIWKGTEGTSAIKHDKREPLRHPTIDIGPPQSFKVKTGWDKETENHQASALVRVKPAQGNGDTAPLRR